MYIKKISNLKIFIIAFVIRIIVIFATPFTNSFTDLCIYIDSGQLISKGINPYKFTDKPELRNGLRIDGFAYHFYTCETQERWNYFASGNLPLALLLFGFLDFISPSYLSYRLGFAFFDSILSVVIAVFVTKNWQRSNYKINNILYSYLALGAFSPVLIQNGTIISEHKGAAILLILGCVLCLQSKNIFLKYWGSAFLVGCSIAFIGLGIFIIPLCIYYLFFEENSILSSSKIYSILRYLIIVCLFATIWFIPFWPDVFNMILNRLSTSLGLSHETTKLWSPHLTAPLNSSPWRIVFAFAPNYWQLIHWVYIILFLSINFYGIYLKKLSIQIITANLFVLFLSLFLWDGSLDRINIGILIAILFLGNINYKYAFLMVKFYFWGGVLDLIISLLLKVIPNFKDSFISTFQVFESFYFGLLWLTFYMIILVLIIKNKTINTAQAVINYDKKRL